jgi:hypothetical protein
MSCNKLSSQDNDQIIFDKVVSNLIKENDVYHIFKNENRIILIKKTMFPNSIRYVLIFYDFDGEEINKYEYIEGEYKFIFLDSLAKIIASQHAMLVRANDSYLFDCNGNLLFTFIHDYENKQTIITNDNEYIIFVSNRLRKVKDEEKPIYPRMNVIAYNHLIIYNLETGLLEKEIDIDEITEVEIELGVNKYDIKLIPADLPG